MSDAAFDSSYDYTPALVARFARSELRSRYGGFLMALGMAFAWSLLCLRSSTLVWLSGFLMGFVAAFGVMLWKWYRGALASASVYAGAPISVRLDTAGIRLSSPVLTSECPWSSVAALHRLPEGFLLVRKGSQQAVPLPREALSPEAAAFLVSAVREAGGRVDREPSAGGRRTGAARP
ncbi:MAG: YcxB family protein [Thermoanaerobaculia bacterium]